MIDTERLERQGFPEVVFAEGKSDETLLAASSRILEAHGQLLVTRVAGAQGTILTEAFPNGVHCPLARLFVIGQHWSVEAKLVAVVSAGSSDQAVAEEAALTLEFLGVTTMRIADCGVAGLHRLLARIDEIRTAHVVIVLAGMEGTLPSVVGGLVHCPVIAVPTSVGYGTGLGGFAAMLAMLNSCAAGVTVVNIDNGFGAAVGAFRMLGLPR